MLEKAARATHAVFHSIDYCTWKPMMNRQRHGFAVGLERFEKNSLITLKAVGTLTHEDYQEVTPILNSVLEDVSQPRIRLLFDASEFTGWKVRAAWDDLKLDFKHGNKFAKIAFYGGKNWHTIASRIGSWCISGEMKFFDNFRQAIAYLEQD